MDDIEITKKAVPIEPENTDPRPLINEESGIHKEWYKEATQQTLETLPAFMNKMIYAFNHDYGTVCHATACAAIAAATIVSRMHGITGFQAGAVMWEFITHWSHFDGPLRLVEYDQLLYPQYEEKMTERMISKTTWEYLQDKAKLLLETHRQDGFGSEACVNHWLEIIAGKVPFGYGVKPE